jgi:hypothetical protein
MLLGEAFLLRLKTWRVNEETPLPILLSLTYFEFQIELGMK